MKSVFSQETFASFIDGQMDVASDQEEVRHCIVTDKPFKRLRWTNSAQLAKALNLNSQLDQFPLYQRASILNQAAALLRTYKQPLAEMITREMGKALTESEGEVEYAASYFDWFSEEAKRIYGRIIPSSTGEKKLFMRYEPIGACGIITPWNFPVAMAARKIAPAFAAGCPVIAKPSSITPLSLIALAAICSEAGFPKNSFNVVLGKGEEIGTKLCEAAQIRKVSFTGSCEAGKSVYCTSSKFLKKVTMELGGNAPVIVCNDANLELACKEILNAKFRVSGQTCVCANRFFIQEGIFDSFLKEMRHHLEHFKVGNPLDRSVQMSNVLHPTSKKKLLMHLQDALEKGASLQYGDQNQVGPKLLTAVTKDMLVFHEENFSPIMPILPFKTPEQALALANETAYGLASYAFTQDLQKAQFFAEGLNFGIVGINDGAPSSPELPFGGRKDSGFGVEGGPTGIYEYLIQKAITIRT